MFVVEEPRLWVDTKWVEPTGKKLYVDPSQNLQDAFDYAGPGDTIVLQPGAIYKGNFLLSKKTDYVYVTTDGFDIKPGNRARPEDAPKMAKIVTGSPYPILKTKHLASYWRFVGIEFYNERPDVDVINLVQLQPDYPSTVIKAVEDFPHHIIFDRCLAHGTPGDRLRRAFRFGGAHQAVVDSSVYDCFLYGVDSQAISDSQGPGPYKIVNNYLSAASEIVAFGGSNPVLRNIFPSDIEIRGNYFYRPLAWKDIPKDPVRGEMLVKNWYESKHSRRLLIEGNIFENNWVHAQVGFGIVLTPVFYNNLTDESGTPVHAIEDTIIRNNILSNTPAAISILGTGVNVIQPDGSTKRAPSRRQIIENNMWIISGNSARIIQVINGSDQVAIIRNLFDAVGGKGTLLNLGSSPSKELWFKDNVAPWLSYGVWYGTGTVNTRAKWEAAMTPPETLDERFHGNQLVGTKSATLYVPPANEFKPDYTQVANPLDMEALRLATAHAIDGQTYVAPPPDEPVPPTLEGLTQAVTGIQSDIKAIWDEIKALKESRP